MFTQPGSKVSSPSLCGEELLVVQECVRVEEFLGEGGRPEVKVGVVEETSTFCSMRWHQKVRLPPPHVNTMIHLAQLYWLLIGLEILHYEAPKPVIGIHRYVFVLFKQEGPLLVMPPMYRNNFNTREFAATCDLGLPVAAVYFNAQKQAGGRRRC